SNAVAEAFPKHSQCVKFPTVWGSSVHSLYTRRKSRNSKLLAVAAYAVRNFTTCAACVVKLHVSENSANRSEEHTPCIRTRDAGLCYIRLYLNYGGCSMRHQQ